MHHLLNIPFRMEERKQLYAESSAMLDRLDALLADGKSRQCLEDAVIAWSQWQPMRYVESGQYRPCGLPDWPRPLRMIDCGAFIGDTLADFHQHGYAFEAIAAFEPYPDSFQKLVQNTQHLENIVRFPCAVGENTKSVHFDTHGSPVSHHIGETGNISVQCVSLDDVLPDFAPNFIKMDIEGAEPEAILGARHIISKYHPCLAICLYHRPEHLWQIPFLLDEWKLGYRFYMRQHHSMFEFVLYALPSSPLNNAD
jgi:FkbM family methyltransferase